MSSVIDLVSVKETTDNVSNTLTFDVPNQTILFGGFKIKDVSNNIVANDEVAPLGYNDNRYVMKNNDLQVINGNISLNKLSCNELAVQGNIYNINTETIITDAMKIENIGTAPTLIVNQKYTTAQPIVQFKDDDVIVFQLGENGIIQNNPTIDNLQNNVLALQNGNVAIWGNLQTVSSRLNNNENNILALQNGNVAIWSNLEIVSTRLNNNESNILALQNGNVDIWSNLSSVSTRLNNNEGNILALQNGNVAIWGNLDVASGRLGTIEKNVSAISSTTYSPIFSNRTITLINNDVWFHNNDGFYIHRFDSVDICGNLTLYDTNGNNPHIIKAEQDGILYFDNLSISQLNSNILGLQNSNISVWGNLSSTTTRLSNLETANSLIYSKVSTLTATKSWYSVPMLNKTDLTSYTITTSDIANYKYIYFGHSTAGQTINVYLPSSTQLVGYNGYEVRILNGQNTSTGGTAVANAMNVINGSGTYINNGSANLVLASRVGTNVALVYDESKTNWMGFGRGYS